MRAEKRARRPVSYAGASDPGPCEGRQASPSNPNHAAKARAPVLCATVVLRCTEEEKTALRERAALAGRPASVLLREALGLTQARRRKPVPRVDPRLVLAVGRIGGNLNQLARRVNTAAHGGQIGPREALAVAAQLVAIERQLAGIVAAAQDREGPRC